MILADGRKVVLNEVDMITLSTGVLATGSTTARSLATRFAEVVNVKDFGAACNGVADDAAAIQAAIDAVDITGGKGGVVILPFGVYNLGTTTITGRNRVYISGGGRRATLLNYSGTGTAVRFTDTSEGGGLIGVRIGLGSSTTAVALELTNSALDVRRCTFDDLELVGTVAIAGQIGLKAITSGGRIISENYFGDIAILDMAKPVVMTGPEGNVFGALDISNFGNGAGSIAIDNTSHANHIVARVAGVQGGVTTPVGYKEQANSNIVDLSVDIGAGGTALNISGIRNNIRLQRALNTTPIGTIGAWNTVIDHDIAFIQRVASKGTVIAAPGLSAGWGTTATVDTLSGNDTRFAFRVNSSGTGQAANPTITVNFIDGNWPVAPFGIIARNGGNQLTVANTWVLGIATITITFLGTPVDGENYTYNGIVIG